MITRSTIEDAVNSGAWLVGQSELVTERLMELQDRYPGLQEVNVGASVMSTKQSVILEQLDVIGKEVMPLSKRRSNNHQPVAAFAFHVS